MQVPAYSNFGALSALPFLFSLMGFTGLFFVISLYVVIADREEAERAQAKVQQQVQEAQARAQELHTLRNLIESIKGQLSKASSARRAHADTEESRKEWQRQSAAVEESQKKLDALQREKTELHKRLQDLQSLRETDARRRLSRQELEAKIQQLKAEIEALKQKMGSVQRELDNHEQVPAKDLVPGGIRRSAVFMECDAQGVWIMPERKLLEPSVSAAAREIFLKKIQSIGYVVFFIRPAGFDAFKKYRDVLQEYNRTSKIAVEYGYEPVNADWKLVYP